ncbi:MAG: M18 family aminopeptidase [Ilumatobacteraceae bacterium]
MAEDGADSASLATAAPTIESLARYLDASTSPYHAAATSAAALLASGFVEREVADAWEPTPAGFCRRGGALVAWRFPDGFSPSDGFSIVGAHTDSPGLRVKPAPDMGLANWKQLGVEVYGGVLLNSWLDRDLGVSGRLVTIDGATHLVRVDDAIARIPQLAIHLDREISTQGLNLDKQQHLQPVWGIGTFRPGEFREYLAERASVRPGEIAGWELQFHDLTPARVLGHDSSLFASGRLDNLLSCWAATTAIAGSTPARHASVIALFDHEEVGSSSSTGAAGPILEHVLDRLLLMHGSTGDDRYRCFAESSCISADNAHAVHPNYPERHDPGHRPLVNAGPALKVNSNQRYATSGTTAALFQRACATAGVPFQTFVSKNTMPCGSTIGPITATRLGIETVDIGVPQLSMHSARELCGTADPVFLARALAAYFSS